MKKLFCVVLAMCLAGLVSCTVKQDDTITGDVKKDNEILSLDDQRKENDKNDSNENSIGNEASETQNKTVTPEELVRNLGCEISDGGAYYNDAVSFAEAIKEKDTLTSASYTGGKRENYDFVDGVTITDYTLYPFAFSEEKLAKMNENYIYPGAEDNYLVGFDVEHSTSDEFDDGKTVYYMGFEMNPLSGNLLSVFVPAEDAKDFAFVTYNQEYTELFIKEFASLYFGKLEEGRNYPDSFDFSDSSHLITHLMARSGVYGEPPYTFEEVNGFIAECFDGNDGLSLSQMNTNGWTSAGVVYPNDDPDRIYGCSWGHGGMSVEHKIVETESDGNRQIYTVELYADYAKFAKACTLVYHFDVVENELPLLIMVELRDNTGREIAVLSV